MKPRYCIGFFAGVFLLVSAIGIGYQLSYKFALDRQQARVESEIPKQNTESVTTKVKQLRTKDTIYVNCTAM